MNIIKDIQRYALFKKEFIALCEKYQLTLRMYYYSDFNSIEIEDAKKLLKTYPSIKEYIETEIS